ncbi:MAG: 2,3-bisphosphoglycerate-independent phosphoglycerate mutase [Neomegalonema sp.]|nr:2,3-bisphosphoglycerate-independent phosphoglycerate mutase [Neomegalonema sp.]
MTDARTTVVLCILDGWGLGDGGPADATALGATPHFDRMMANRATATLATCGPDVGLPERQMGNSEVGHMNLGAGRVVWMDLPKIDRAIQSGAYADAASLGAFIAKVKAAGGAVHIAGLCSAGGVHAHHRHIAATAKICAAAGAPVKLHLFLDGRDTAPKSALEAIAALREELGDAENIEIATVAGRYFAMDRDKRWDRVARAYRAVAFGDGDRVESPEAAIKAAYDRGETDEFIAPAVIGSYAGPTAGDGLFMANFRADRAREILHALLEPGFDGFDRGAKIEFSAALGMVSYSAAIDAWMDVLFPSETIVNGLGAWVASLGKTQFRLAETEKYPHVTFFFNGGEEAPYAGEERHMAPSPKVATYDLAPEMAAAEVGAALTKAIDSGAYDLIVVNFANPDMVGHTGDVAAAAKAVEAVDKELGAAIAAVERVGGAMLVTADHGNCEMMVDPATGGPHTAHTLNRVPIALIDARPHAPSLRLVDGGRLADVAPTLLELLDAPTPEEMTGGSLLQSA